MSDEAGSSIQKSQKAVEEVENVLCLCEYMFPLTDESASSTHRTIGKGGGKPIIP